MESLKRFFNNYNFSNLKVPDLFMNFKAKSNKIVFPVLNKHLKFLIGNKGTVVTSIIDIDLNYESVSEYFKNNTSEGLIIWCNGIPVAKVNKTDIKEGV